MAKRIFISYRREDTASAAGRVYDRLCRFLPPSDVFIDVNTIRGGEKFEEAVVATLEKSDALLAFIGRKWLDPSEGGKPRICEPDDYVRAELLDYHQFAAAIAAVRKGCLSGARSNVPAMILGDHLFTSPDARRSYYSESKRSHQNRGGIRPAERYFGRQS
jgi:hypothetical protein